MVRACGERRGRGARRSEAAAGRGRAGSGTSRGGLGSPAGAARPAGQAAVAALLLVLAPVPAAAQQVGRYEAVALAEGQRPGGSGSLQPRVLILDTAEGHLWTWEENVRLDQPGRPPTFGAAVVYQGRVRPGTRIGEVVGQAPRE